MTRKSIIILSLVFLHSSFINGKTCKWQLVQEWHPQPLSYVVNWTLTENICTGFYRDCCALSINTKMSTSSNQVVPQICPLQIQLGDILVISSEPSLQFLEMNLMNVSEASFIDCLQNATYEDQLLFGCKLKGSHIVNPLWLSAGTHYFITVMANGPSLCQLGLRLNVTVKQQFCQESLSSAFCSGHGKCLSNMWDTTYSCHCQPPYSGKYCQGFDISYDRPCKNNDSCINTKEKWNKRGSKCICHSPFTGPFCEESMKLCVSQSCWEEETQQNNTFVYVCECSEGFLSQNHETDVNECPLTPCQNGTDGINISNDNMCICSLMLTRKLCKRIEIPLDSFPWKNDTIYIRCEEDYQFSCMPGFTGKNCQKVIDHCSLLNINCLSEEWSFNIIGRFTYAYNPGCTGYSYWLVKNGYLLHQYPCYSGATCHNICQAIHSSQFECVWQLEFTGENCKVIDAYFTLATNCSGSSVYENNPEDISYACGFPCKCTLQICANGCSYLSEEDNERFWCLHVLRWTAKMHIENMTNCEENGCQCEVICEEESKRLRYNCSLGYFERSCLVSGDCPFGNQSTSVHALYLAYLHNYKSSCLQRYEKSTCEIKTEDCKSLPCKNGTTSISELYFCKRVLRFTGKYFLRNQILYWIILLIPLFAVSQMCLIIIIVTCFLIWQSKKSFTCVIELFLGNSLLTIKSCSCK